MRRALAAGAVDRIGPVFSSSPVFLLRQRVGLAGGGRPHLLRHISTIPRPCLDFRRLPSGDPQQGPLMVSSISFAPPRPIFPGFGQLAEAALKRQIAARQAEIQAATDKAEAARLAGEVEALKAKLAVLEQKKAPQGTAPAQR